MVDVIFTKPVKLDRRSNGPRLAALCCSGPSVTTWLPSFAPAALYTANVIVAD